MKKLKAKKPYTNSVLKRRSGLEVEGKITVSKHSTAPFILKNNHDENENQNSKILTVPFSFLAGWSPALSQNSGKEQMTIPLYDPGKSGTLKVSLLSGSIHVTGYTGKLVIVDITSEENPDKKEGNEKHEMGNGMIKFLLAADLKLQLRKTKIRSQ